MAADPTLQELRTQRALARRRRDELMSKPALHDPVKRRELDKVRRLIRLLNDELGDTAFAGPGRPHPGDLLAPQAGTGTHHPEEDHLV